MTGPADEVEVVRTDTVVTIRLNRPAKRNAITGAMYTRLADALTEADSGDAAVVLLTGAGGAFTAGNDLRDMVENPVLGDDAPPLRFLAALTELHAVLLAAVDGPALGVGTTVLLHCDLVYATADSVFGFPFVDLGLVPEAASTLLLPQLTGHQRAAELMLLAERFGAARAAELGLVTEVVADAEELSTRVAQRTAELLAKPRAALLATKALLRESGARTVPERLRMDSRVLRELIREKTNVAG
jgi:enoyl-CoA hydratase/carnithine racemase